MSRLTWGLGTLCFVLVGTTWEFAAWIAPASFVAVPPPSTLPPVFLEMLNQGIFLKDMSASLTRYSLGLGLGIVVGILLGIATGRDKRVAALLSPLCHYLRSIPSVALIPVAIAWFGISDLQKVFIIIWGCAFPVWLNTSVGLAGVDERYVWTARTLGAERVNLFISVYLPHALPFILSGMRISIANGFFALAASELAGSSSGIAYRVFRSYELFRTEEMMIGILTIGSLSLFFDTAFTRTFRKIVPWWRPGQ
ncbi:MAG: ABC transporter permease [Alphaproteobacteria bacterium]|jgi:ABC-type nitrate/sulfonate/bicarbonate transport system permease component|nr:ABC transporter permease [Roseomonas sp.]MCA3284608.1 ABC transporter permease [Roseomonas sp.]